MGLPTGGIAGTYRSKRAGKNTIGLTQSVDQFKGYTSGRAEFTLGVIQMQRENALTVLPELEAGARDAPDFIEMHSDLGAILEPLNRLPQAQAEYSYVLRLDPNNQDARAALARQHAQGRGDAP